MEQGARILFVRGCCMQETRGKGSDLGKLERRFKCEPLSSKTYHLVRELDKSPGHHGKDQRCTGDTAPRCRESRKSTETSQRQQRLTWILNWESRLEKRWERGGRIGAWGAHRGRRCVCGGGAEAATQLSLRVGEMEEAPGAEGGAQRQQTS